MALLVHVDDIGLTGNDTSACKEFKIYLNACFSIKDLGPLKYFLALRWLVDQTAYFFANENMPWKLWTTVGFWEQNQLISHLKKIIN